MGYNESSAMRKTHRPKCLKKENEESIYKQLNKTPESARTVSS